MACKNEVELKRLLVDLPEVRQYIKDILWHLHRQGQMYINDHTGKLVTLDQPFILVLRRLNEDKSNYDPTDLINYAWLTPFRHNAMTKNALVVEADGYVHLQTAARGTMIKDIEAHRLFNHCSYLGQDYASRTLNKEGESTQIHEFNYLVNTRDLRYIAGCD